MIQFARIDEKEYFLVEVSKLKKEFELGLLCTRSAMIAEVPESVRAVVIKTRKKLGSSNFDYLIRIHYFYEGMQDEEYIDELSSINTVIISSFSVFLEEEEFFQLDIPKIVPGGMDFAYLRYEENLPVFKRKKFIFEKFYPGNITLVFGEAMLGRVTKELVYVHGDIRDKGKVLYLHFYHLDPISEKIRGMWQEAIEETSDALQHCLPHKLVSHISHVERIPKEKSEMPLIGCLYCKKEVDISLIEGQK